MLLLVDYLSKWVDVISTRINETRVVVKFLRENIFLGLARLVVIITDQGTHFKN